MAKFVPVDRDTALLLRPDMREWVPADDGVHLVIEAVEQMDVSCARVNERGTGSAQFPPAMLLALLVYCYSQGICSSRRIERATHTDVAVRYLTGDTHPDHATIALFRQRNEALFKQVFRDVLQLARQLGVLRLGTIFLDGTKLRANASARANRRESELQAEIAALDAEIAARLAAAETADQTDVAEQLPPGLSEAQTRREKLIAARAALQQRTQAQQRSDPDSSGNTTDPDSRRHRTRHGAIQGYTAQIAATVDGLIVAARVTAENQDRRQLQPTLEQVLPLGTPHTIVADTGYDNHEQIQALTEATAAQIYIPPQTPVEVPDAAPSAALSGTSPAIGASAHGARAGVAAAAADHGRTDLRHHQIGAPVRSVPPARVAGVQAEWTLVCTAFNLRRIHRLVTAAA